MVACGVILIVWGIIGSFLSPLSNAGGIGIVSGIACLVAHSRIKRIELALKLRESGLDIGKIKL